MVVYSALFSSLHTSLVQERGARSRGARSRGARSRGGEDVGKRKGGGEGGKRDIPFPK